MPPELSGKDAWPTIAAPVPRSPPAGGSATNSAVPRKIRRDNLIMNAIRLFVVVALLGSGAAAFTFWKRAESLAGENAALRAELETLKAAHASAADSPEHDWTRARDLIYPAFRPVGTQGLAVEHADGQSAVVQRGTGRVVVDERPS